MNTVAIIQFCMGSTRLQNKVVKLMLGTVFPFNYNNFAELEALVNVHNIDVIKMKW